MSKGLECRHCKAFPKERASLCTERGSPEGSFHNAHLLLKERGLPDQVVLFHSGDHGGDLVEAWWTRGGWFRFRGFGWGCRGSVAQSLAAFFSLCLIQVGLEEIAGWPSGKRKLTGKLVFLRRSTKWLRSHVGGGKVVER